VDPRIGEILIFRSSTLAENDQRGVQWIRMGTRAHARRLSTASTLAATVIGFVLGGIFANQIAGAVALLIGLTGLFGGAAHYAAILAGWPERDVERATGIGFFLGGSLGILGLIADALL
jgi:hypothetical protein